MPLMATAAAIAPTISLTSCGSINLKWDNDRLTTDVMAFKAKKMYTFNVDYANNWASFSSPSFVFVIHKKGSISDYIHPYETKIHVKGKGQNRYLKINDEFDYYSDGTIYLKDSYYKDKQIKFTIKTCTKEDITKDQNYCFEAS